MYGYPYVATYDKSVINSIQNWLDYPKDRTYIAKNFSLMDLLIDKLCNSAIKIVKLDHVLLHWTII